jgi:hypothetical protein
MRPPGEPERRAPAAPQAGRSFLRGLAGLSAAVVLAALLLQIDVDALRETAVSGAAGIGLRVGLLLFLVLVIAATLAPFLALCVVQHVLPRSRAADAVLALGTMLVLGWYLFVFWTVFWFNETPDAQDAIALIVAPIPAWLATAAISGLAWAVARLARR